MWQGAAVCRRLVSNSKVMLMYLCLIEDKKCSEIQSNNTIVCNVYKEDRDEGIVNHHQSFSVCGKYIHASSMHVSEKALHIAMLISGPSSEI